MGEKKNMYPQKNLNGGEKKGKRSNIESLNYKKKEKNPPF